MNQSLDIWEILFAFIVFVVVCVGLISDPERITIPQVGAVQLVEMERLNEASILITHPEFLFG